MPFRSVSLIVRPKPVPMCSVLQHIFFAVRGLFYFVRFLLSLSQKVPFCPSQLDRLRLRNFTNYLHLITNETRRPTHPLLTSSCIVVKVDRVIAYIRMEVEVILPSDRVGRKNRPGPGEYVCTL